MTASADPINDRLDAIEWMPLPPAAAVPSMPTKRGAHARNNATIDALRARFPLVVAANINAGAATVNKAVAREMRRLHHEHAARLLGVAVKELYVTNPADPSSAAVYISDGKPDELLTFLDTAIVSVQAAPRANSDLCACGQPLHPGNRTYCTLHKQQKAATNKQQRRERPPTARQAVRPSPGPAPAPRPGAPDIDIDRSEFLAGGPGPAPHPKATPTVKTVISPTGVCLLIIDFRAATDRTLRRLSDEALIELGEHSGGRCIAIDAGCTSLIGNLTTDVALATDTAGGVVIWVAEANASKGCEGFNLAHLPGIDFDPASIIRAAISPIATSELRAKFSTEAAKLAASDPQTIVDGYELRSLATQHMELADPSPVTELLGVPTPPTPNAWATAQVLAADNDQDMTVVRAIESAALLAS